MGLLANTGRFIHKHLVLIAMVLLLGYWIMGQQNFHHPLPMMSKSGGFMMAESSLASMDMDFAEEGMAPMAMKSRSVRQAYADDGFADVAAEDRKIVKNGRLRLEVENTEESKDLMESEIEALGGSVTNSNSWQPRHGVLAYNMTIRVPAESFETLIENLTKLGSKLEESFNTQDITASYQDAESRITNLKAREQSLRDLLAKKNDELTDLLSVDRELWSVTEQIERLQATQNRRDKDVAFSTLQLSLEPETQVGDLQNPEWNVKKSWAQTLNKFKKSVQDLVDYVFQIIGLAPLWIPILFVVWILKTWVFKKRLSAPTVSNDNFGNPNA